MVYYQVKETAEKGRHLVAARDIEPGVNLVCQEAYACVLYDDQVPLRCDFCLRLCENPLRCSKSKFARYCSREHQRAAWKAWYKNECDALVACAPKIPPPTVRLAARVLWRREREASCGSDQADHGYAAVEQLQHHWSQLDDSRKALYAQMAVVVRQYMQGSGQAEASLPGTREVAQLLARFACNNHTICDDELRPLGIGLYPLGALLNHSSTPTCMQSFKGRQIAFRSLRAVRQGEELSISYIELAATGQERRQELLQQYLFDCCHPALQPQLSGYSIWPQPAAQQALPGGAGWVSWHGPSSSPPWPVEGPDGELTAVECKGSGGSWRRLPGGMHVRVVAAEGDLAAGGGDDGSDGEEEEDAAASSSSRGGSGGRAEQRVEVYCWGAAFALPPGSNAEQVDIATAAASVVHIQQLLQQADTATKQQQHAQAMALLQKALHTGANLTIQPPHLALAPNHILCLRIKTALLKACIDEASSWDLALQTARQLLPMYQLAYPKGPWPNVALHYATLAKLESYVGDMGRALKAAGSAAQQLQVTHGGDSSVLREMMRLRYDLEAEMAVAQ